MFLHMPKPIEYSKLKGKETSGEEIYEVWDMRKNPSKVIERIRFQKGIKDPYKIIYNYFLKKGINLDETKFVSGGRGAITGYHNNLYSILVFKPTYLSKEKISNLEKDLKKN